MEYIKITKQNNIAIVTLCRERVMNCFNLKMRDELSRCMEQLNEDDSIKGVIITGSGGNFSSGGDMKEMALINEPYQAYALSYIEKTAFLRVQMCKHPVIAAISGYCLGAGFDLALSCDFRFVAEDVIMGFPEVKYGIVVGGGGVSKLARHVGLTKTKELLFTGRQLTSKEALSLQLVNSITKDPLEYSIEFINKNLLESSSISIGEYKRLLHDYDLTYASMVRESEATNRCFSYANNEETKRLLVEKCKGKNANDKKER